MANTETLCDTPRVGKSSGAANQQQIEKKKAMKIKWPSPWDDDDGTDGLGHKKKTISFVLNWLETDSRTIRLDCLASNLTWNKNYAPNGSSWELAEVLIIIISTRERFGC